MEQSKRASLIDIHTQVALFNISNRILFVVTEEVWARAIFESRGRPGFDKLEV